MAQNRVMDAVVKIFCVHTEPNWSLPWQRKRQFSSTSSGFLVEAEGGARWLLTNAHSVEYHSQVGGAGVPRVVYVACAACTSVGAVGVYAEVCERLRVGVDR